MIEKVGITFFWFRRHYFLYSLSIDGKIKSFDKKMSLKIEWKVTVSLNEQKNMDPQWSAMRL